MGIDLLPKVIDRQRIWFWQTRRYKSAGYRLYATSGWPFRFHAEREELVPHEMIDAGPPPVFRQMSNSEALAMMAAHRG